MIHSILTQREPIVHTFHRRRKCQYVEIDLQIVKMKGGYGMFVSVREVQETDK